MVFLAVFHKKNKEREDRVCPFWHFSPIFIVLAIFPLERRFLGVRKSQSRARKGQMVDSGLQGPNVTTPQLATLHGLASNWAKNCYKIGGRNAKRTNVSRTHPSSDVIFFDQILAKKTPDYFCTCPQRTLLY